MSLLAKGFSAAKILISFQFFMKVFNFGLGIAIARIMDPSVYGAGNIQVPLTTAVILHLSRETFRRVAIRSTESPFGVMWLSVFITIILSVLTFLYQRDTATLIICIASVIEVLCEPFLIMNLMQINVKNSIIAESLSTIVIHVVIILTSSYGVLSFCFGTLAGSITNLIIHVSRCEVWPNSLKISDSDRKLTKTYLMIGFIKFFLTEGEKIFLTSMDFTSSDRGVYALITNLCGIVPRAIFSPVEQITHVVFTKDLELDKAKVGLLKPVCGLWLLGLGLFVYSQAYSELIIKILYGSNWEGTDAAGVLATYGFYLLIMGLNGTLEAINSAVSTPEQLSNKKYSLTTCFIAFMTSAYLLSGYGATGLVMACCVSMTVSIIFTIRGLLKNFKWLKIEDLLPSVNTLVSFAVAYVFIKALKTYKGEIELVVGGCIVGLVHAYFLYRENREFFASAKDKTI